MELPVGFEAQMRPLLGDQWEAFHQALQEDCPISIRFNKAKPLANAETHSKVLQSLEPVPHCSTGYYLPTRPSFTLDPRFHAGAYYVQEAGSMYLEQYLKKYLDLTQPLKALDLCAAPGGKSTHIISLLNADSLLISNEVMPQRAHILAENATKWGYGNWAVTNNQPKDFANLGGYFDCIVTDVPCSGEGMFRKEPQAIADWSIANVELCATRQRSILEDVWEALKENGLLIYSTCTFNAQEDEENVNWIAQELGAQVLEQQHFYFHTGKNEGFFIAALRKTSAVDRPLRLKGGDKNKNKAAAKAMASLNKSSLDLKASRVLLPQNFWTEITEKDATYAIPAAYENDFKTLDKYLRYLKKGIKLSTLKGKDLVPHTDLALSIHLNTSAFPIIEVDRETALHYLKGESIQLPVAPKGYVLLSFQNIPLGWVKSLGNRCNNLYPSEWRIRMNLPNPLCELPF